MYIYKLYIGTDLLAPCKRNNGDEVARNADEHEEHAAHGSEAKQWLRVVTEQLYGSQLRVRPVLCHSLTLEAVVPSVYLTRERTPRYTR